MKFIPPVLLIPIVLIFSSCIEFEGQNLTYYHDEEKDEIRITLKYQGIFGNLYKGQNAHYNSRDIATGDRLNQKQIEQLASVLEQKRAFFFSNWIFEFSPKLLAQMLDDQNERSKDHRFGKAEIDLIQNLIINGELNNIGFYSGTKDKVCGAQTLRIQNLSAILTLANKVIKRQIIARISEWKKDLSSKKLSTTPDEEVIQLLEKKMATPYTFIKIEGNLVTLQFPSIFVWGGREFHSDPEMMAQSVSKDLPSGANVSMKDGDFIIKIGTQNGETGKLQKKCFDGYSPNAKNYLKEEYKSLFMSQKKVENKLQNFLAGRN